MELILELTGWRISSTEIMSYNIIFPLHKESDSPSENVRKTSGDSDDTKKSLFFTTEMVVKKGNTDIFDRKRKTNPNVVKEGITPPISEKRRLTQSTKHRNHKHPIKQ